MTATDLETAAMRRALELARTADVPLGPNPRVGAVLLDPDGREIAAGVHRGAGTPHAEADVIARAGERARGSTAVVSLEPCNHTGRTGPCTRALAEAGVARVVFAQADPNPVAAGGSAALLAAGVEVEGGVLAAEAAQVNRVWTFAMEHRRPLVTWKFAGTLDGRSAAADGSSMWITGTQARADVHRQRAGCDTILVGTGTVVADNPRLNVRGPDGRALPPERQPLRAVMGMRALDHHSTVFDKTAPSTVLRTRDPCQALEQLFALERLHVWLEGGPTLAAAFVRSGLVDEVVAYVAPALFGAGRSVVADLGITGIDEALRLDLVDVARLGDDVRLTMRARSDVHRNR